jgi:WD40 repeat protein
MKRFALYGRSAIEQAPLQVYCSALIFALIKSTVRKQFEDKIPTWIRRLSKVHEEWSALLVTLEGHTDLVKSVAFSPDGALLASTSDDGTIRLWDTVTGAALNTLEGHMDCVNSVVFLHTGKLLASASSDTTIRLWDTATGVALNTFSAKTLVGHAPQVNSVAFSHDSTC